MSTNRRAICWSRYKRKLLNQTKKTVMDFWETLAIAFIPALLTGIIAYAKNRVDILKYKADSMAERSAKYFLRHKGYTDRRFETIKKYLGGWDNEEDDLRKILVRAGAVRVFSENEEWWYLLSRGDERIKKKTARKK